MMAVACAYWWIVLILEADSLGECVDRVGGSGEEMPAGRGARASVALEVFLLLGGGDRGRFLRVEADRDDVELIADVELHHLHGAAESGEGFAAEHGAVVVDQVQDQRLRSEVVAESDGVAGVVDKGEICGNLSVEMLLNADVLEVWRADVGRRGHDALGHGLSERGRREQEEQEAL
jgi:hypothetical protein